MAGAQRQTQGRGQSPRIGVVTIKEDTKEFLKDYKDNPGAYSVMDILHTVTKILMGIDSASKEENFRLWLHLMGHLITWIYILIGRKDSSSINFRYFTDQFNFLQERLNQIKEDDLKDSYDQNYYLMCKLTITWVKIIFFINYSSGLKVLSRFKGDFHPGALESTLIGIWNLHLGPASDVGIGYKYVTELLNEFCNDFEKLEALDVNQQGFYWMLVDDNHLKVSIISTILILNFDCREKKFPVEKLYKYVLINQVLNRRSHKDDLYNTLYPYIISIYNLDEQTIECWKREVLVKLRSSE